ncbi:MAG: DNA topoisomerase I, partial [Candidatus Hydrogenedentes bacterium]|nr:DNA topoisomerase I [Candidatus Hydrogenedentota bacterium]
GDHRSLGSGEEVFSLTLDEALALLAQPKRRGRQKKVLREVGVIPGTETKIELFDGRYGPYVSDGKSNASLPKGMDQDKITVEESIRLLEEAALKKGTKKKKAPAKKKKASKKKKTAAKKKTATKKKAAAKKKAATDES